MEKEPDKKKRKQPLDVTITLSPRLSLIIQEWAKELNLTKEDVIISVLAYLLENESIMADIFPLEEN